MSMTAADLMIKIGANVDGAMAGIARADRRLGMFAKGAALGAGVAAVGIAAAVGKSVQAAGNFEQSLNVFQAVSKATGDGMEDVRKKALALGNDMTLPGTSARDAADAMTELAKGGLTVKQSMTAAKGALLLSAAAGMENAEAANLVSQALNSFGLEAKESARVVDLLAGAANASSADIDGIALGMKQASAVFKMGRQPIETLTTSLALMANAGVEGSDAGTSLKTMMMRLQAPTDEAAGQLKKLGVNVRNSKGEMIPMRGIIGQFNAATQGMTDAQRDAAYATIFGADAIRAANIVLGGGVKEWDKMAAASTKSGAAQDLAAAKMKGFNGAMEAFKSSLETLAIVFGTLLLPAFTKLFVGLAQGAVYLSNLVSAFSAGGTAADGMKSKLTPLQGIFQAMSTVVDYFRLKYQQVASAIRAHSAEIRATVDSLRAFFQAVWPLVSAYVKAAWDLIKIYIDTTLKVVGNLIRAVMAIIRGDWETAWKSIAAAALALMNGWASMLKSILTKLVPAILALALRIGKAIVTGILDGLKTLAAMLGAAAIAAVTSAVSATAAAALGLAMSIGSAIVDGILAGVTSLPGRLASKLGGMVTGALGSVKGLLGINSPSRVFMDQVGKPIAEGIILGFLQGAADMPDKIKAPVQAALERARAAVDAGKATLVAAFDRLASSSVQAFDARTNELGARLDTKLNGILAKIEAARGKMTASEAALAAMDAAEKQRGLSEGLSSAQSRLGEANASGDQAAIADAQKAVQAAETAILRAGLEERAAVERAARDKEAARKAEAATKKNVTAQKELAAEREQEKLRLEGRLARLKESLEREPIMWAKSHKGIMKLMGGFAPDYATSGANIGSAFAEGLKSQQKAVAAAAAALAGTAAKYLKANSPTEKGPMSSLDKWWVGVGPALLSGLDSGGLQRGLNAFVPSGAATPNLGFGGGGAGGFGDAGGQTIVLNIDLGTETITKVVRVGLRDVKRRNLTDELV